MLQTTLSRRVSEFIGVTLFGLALLWLVSLATYNHQDAVWFLNTGGAVPPANFAGRVGAFISEVTYQLLGLGSYLIPLVLVVAGWHYFWCKVLEAAYTKLIGIALLFICSTSFLSLAFQNITISGKNFRTGGYMGDTFSGFLSSYLNQTGSVIFILTLLFLSIIISTQFSFGRLFEVIGRAFVKWSTLLKTLSQKWIAKRKREQQRQGVLKKHREKRADIPSIKGTRLKDNETRTARKSSASPPPKSADSLDIKPENSRATAPRLPLPEPAPLQKKNSFTTPPAALFDSPKETHRFDERLLMENARLLQEKCAEFSVEGAVSQIHPGPVVTTFEFKPEAGVKYSKVTSLADDLCLAMEADSVFIERVAGKSTVGIQIPNAERDEISLRELLESDEYQRSKSKLTLALGKSIHGDPVVADLAKMPHLLIAGSTGTGKSVSMNAMLTSILYRATPDDVRLILIDPKRLELGMYEEIPHLLTPVVVDPKRASNALKWAVHEMEQRYKLLAGEGVRNIEQYNRNIKMQLAEQKEISPDSKQEGAPETIPYIVLAIDELADLMMVASNEVEESITRLAQMARAVGIHLILATQRPSVDVITGLIKANFPSRIAFRVSSKVDSRTILDTNGAEQLLGKGDMLYLPPASSRTTRLHGPYISEQESARLASFLRKQGKPGYDETITADEPRKEAVEFERDDLYDEAARLVVSSGHASISYLQRRLRVGFSRAARLVDMMEADGLVSAGTSGKQREILVKPDYFDEVDQRIP